MQFLSESNFIIIYLLIITFSLIWWILTFFFKKKKVVKGNCRNLPHITYRFSSGELEEKFNSAVEKKSGDYRKIFQSLNRQQAEHLKKLNNLENEV